MRSQVINVHRDKHPTTKDKLYFGMIGGAVLKLAWKQRRNALAYARRVKDRYNNKVLVELKHNEETATYN